MKSIVVVAAVSFFVVAAAAPSGCEPAEGEGEGEGEGEPEDCFIGDKSAEAELELVYRTVDGTLAVLEDNGEVPLILPPQGGKVVLVGVRAKHVSCDLQLNAGLTDDCADPPTFIGREGRPVRLKPGDDGWGVPEVVDSLLNYANIPVCPTFASARDGDDEPYQLELRATERLRKGEDAARTHVLTATVVPHCAQPDIFEDCRCECDADFNINLTREEQCPTINDNDTDPGVCPDVQTP